MDTRQKIVTADALPHGRLRVITGYFDPFYAAHARRLRELCTADAVNVVVVDTPESGEYLPARARAELVAALDCVDFVVMAPLTLPPDAIDERDADRQRRRELEQHVVARHR